MGELTTAGRVGRPAWTWPSLSTWDDRGGGPATVSAQHLVKRSRPFGSLSERESGFAFAGAAVTRFIDIAGARKAAAGRADEVRLTDLDETRRLAYAALLARTSGDRALFDATLVNALAHHGLEVDPDEAAGYLQSLDQDASRRWLEDQIDRLTAERGQVSPRARRPVLPDPSPDAGNAPAQAEPGPLG
jgi:hypothetical protein